MAVVNQLILDQLRSDIVLINQLGQHIVHSGGKRLRPLLVLLSAKAFAYQGERHFNLAAAVEFIHTATLLHDDVVDESSLRRGRETANSIWGNEASVLVGDFLYSRGFQLMVAADNMRVLKILADATNTIAEGEVLQLMNVQNSETTEEAYMQVIRCKTAKLFEAAAQLGAVVSGCDETQIAAMAEYGMSLGVAFQIIDDALDYTTSSETMGKNRGDDLAEGKPTLPLIYAYEKGTPAQREIIQQAIEQADASQFEAITQIIKSTKAVEYSYQLAHEYADRAMTSLIEVPELPYREALHGLAQFSVSRSY